MSLNNPKNVDVVSSACACCGIEELGIFNVGMALVHEPLWMEKSIAPKVVLVGEHHQPPHSAH